MPRTDLDSIYRLLFGHPRVIEDLLRGFASSAVGDLLDMTSLKQVAARHVSEGLRQSENDMIWEVRTRQGGRLYVYIMLEFQAKPDRTMPLRMVNYVGQFYRSLLARPEIRKVPRLPQVLPIVIYSGEPPWSAPLEVHELIDQTLPGLVPFGIHMRYLLVDAIRSPGLDRALRNVADSVFRLQRAKSVADGRSEARLLGEWLAGEEWAGLRRVLQRWIIQVLVPTGWPSGRSLPEGADLLELSELLEIEMRTWEDNIRESAEAKGRAKGRAEILVKMARHKFGEAPAAKMATVLGAIQSEEMLDRAGLLLLTSVSGEALLTKLQEI